jgi:small subunit ribosomal protein S2
MVRYLYGERSGIYILDLEKTLTGLDEAYGSPATSAGAAGSCSSSAPRSRRRRRRGAGRPGRHALRQHPLARRDAHELPDDLTASRRLRELGRWSAPARSTYLPKKEVLRLRHEKEKLERNLGGIQGMERLPDAVFVIDTKKEHIAVGEARKLGIPVIAIVDTNCDPDEVDYVIPGNDDAIRSVSLVTRVLADALAEGSGKPARASAKPTQPSPGEEIEPRPKRRRRRDERAGPYRRLAASRERQRAGRRHRSRSGGTHPRGRVTVADISAQQVRELRSARGPA